MCGPEHSWQPGLCVPSSCLPGMPSPVGHGGGGVKGGGGGMDGKGKHLSTALQRTLRPSKIGREGGRVLREGRGGAYISNLHGEVEHGVGIKGGLVLLEVG